MPFYYVIEQETAEDLDSHSVIWASTQRTVVDDNRPYDLCNAVTEQLQAVGIEDTWDLMEGCWEIPTAEQAEQLRENLNRLGWLPGEWDELTDERCEEIAEKYALCGQKPPPDIQERIKHKKDAENPVSLWDHLKED